MYISHVYEHLEFQEKVLILPDSRLIHHHGVTKFLFCFKGQFYTERLEQYFAFIVSFLVSSQATVPRSGCWRLPCSKVPRPGQGLQEKVALNRPLLRTQPCFKEMFLPFFFLVKLTLETRVQRVSSGSSSGSLLLFQGCELPWYPQRISSCCNSTVAKEKALLLKFCTVCPWERSSQPCRGTRELSHHGTAGSITSNSLPGLHCCLVHEGLKLRSATETLQLLLQ